MNQNAEIDIYEFDPTMLPGAAGALLRTNLPWPCQRGKVRDVYQLADHWMIVSTDRLSAFDYVLPSGIPRKGRLLTSMSEFWFSQLDDGQIRGADGNAVPHHRLGLHVPDEVADVVDPLPLEGRIMLVRRADVIPFECVVRGYLEGSGWRAYQADGAICGQSLPSGLRQCDQLPEPIFTPATKADSGHDENVSFEFMADAIGQDLAGELRGLSLQLYESAAAIAAQKGLLIADTKFEFGIIDGVVVLIDEVLTPDSSRYWSAEDYRPGQPQASFDKQFVREYLHDSDWDRASTPPPLPSEIVTATQHRYEEGFRRLTGYEDPEAFCNRSSGT
ncbi:MAG: phosphoribosylaminoimidazolesuccinocarboxamide synthase [Planctomycetota bacterium]